MWNKIAQIFKEEKAPNDDFIKRIRSLVIGEGMLKDGNIGLMEYAIQHMPDGGSIIEIGSYGGLSANVLVYLLGKHGKLRPFFTCDAWIYEGYHDHLKETPDTFIDGRTDVSRSAYSVYMKGAFIAATKLLSSHHLPHAFHMDSAHFFELWNNQRSETDVFGRNVTLGGPISFAYIDGGHSYEVAWRDFEHVSRNLLLNGFMLLDDSADHLPFGSAKMMATIKADKRFKVIASEPNYLIQKVG